MLWVPTLNPEGREIISVILRDDVIVKILEHSVSQQPPPFGGVGPPQRKPIKFKKHYRVRPRPYSFRRLFSSVDKVRKRVDDVFDDLDRESRRRRH